MSKISDKTDKFLSNYSYLFLGHFLLGHSVLCIIILYHTIAYCNREITQMPTSGTLAKNAPFLRKSAE